MPISKCRNKSHNVSISSIAVVQPTRREQTGAQTTAPCGQVQRRGVLMSVGELPWTNDSRSARRTRNAPGKISNFSSLPERRIRQSVARLTPRNLAAALIPSNNGADEASLGTSSLSLKIWAIRRFFSASANRKRIRISFVFESFMTCSVVGRYLGNLETRK